MDGVFHLKTPFTTETIESLRAGDKVTISGVIYGARDTAHNRLIQLIEAGNDLPIPIAGQVIYYLGCSPAPPGRVIGAAGPTSSYRMAPFIPRLLEFGLKGIVGKGKLPEEVRKVLIRYKAIYMVGIGGAGALMAQAIKDARIVAYHDLGPEAIRKLVVKNFPAIVVNDIVGHDLYSNGQEKYGYTKQL